MSLDSNVPPESVHRQVVQKFGRNLEFQPCTGGLSDSIVTCVRVNGVPLAALKFYSGNRWSAYRVHRLATLLEHLSNFSWLKSSDLLMAPIYSTAPAEGHWLITRWRRGRCVPGIGVVEDTQLALAARHLGKLHVALKQWQARPNKSEQKDGFKERLIRLQTLRIDTLPRFSNPIVAELRSSLCDYLASGTRQLLDRLKTIDLDLRPSQWCWRDIWRDHLLFNHAVETGIPEISGLLDPDAFGFSHPIFDVVRLLGTLLLPNDSRWSIAVDTYNAAEPPTPLDLHALKSIDDASTVLSAVQWLTWLNEGTFDPVVPPAAAVARIRELTQKLTVLVAADYGTRWDA